MDSHGSSSVAENPACVDMVDGRLIENLHVDDARRLLAWADAIAKRATQRLTLRRQAHGETDRESRGRYWRSSGHRRGHMRWPSALAARSARAAVGARSGGDEGFSFLGTPGIVGYGPGNVGGATHATWQRPRNYALVGRASSGIMPRTCARFFSAFLAWRFAAVEVAADDRSTETPLGPKKPRSANPGGSPPP